MKKRVICVRFRIFRLRESIKRIADSYGRQVQVAKEVHCILRALRRKRNDQITLDPFKGLQGDDISKPEEPHPTLRAGDIVLDLQQQRAFICGKEVELTSIEFRLLTELLRQANNALSPDVLLQKVWGAGYQGEDRLVWRAIHHLRRKIEEDPQHPKRLQTRPGIGYMLMSE